MPSLRAVAKTLVVAAYLSGSAVSGPVQDQQVDLHSQDGVDGIQAFKDANRAAMISSLAHYDAKRQESNNSSPVATQTTTAVVTSGATSVPPNTPTSPPTTTITSSPTTSITTPATSTIPTTSSLSTPTSSSSPTSSPSSTPSPTSTPTSTPTSQPTSSSPPTTSRQPTSTFVSPPSSSSEATSSFPTSSTSATSSPVLSSGSSQATSSSAVSQGSSLTPIAYSSPSSTASASTVPPSSASSAAATSALPQPSSSPQTSFSVAPSTGLVPQPVTSSQNGQVVTQVSSVPVASVTQGPVVSGTDTDVETTDAFGVAITLSGASSGKVYTVTDISGHVITTTYNPGGEPVRSIQVLTSTLPNGEPSTLTSVAVIVPTVVNGANQNASARPASGTAAAAASLVTGNAGVQSARLGREAIALVAGAGAVAALL